MDQTYLTIIWIAVTILFIAFFEGIEIAFVSVNRLQIELRKKQGKSSGLIISRFMEEPSRFIGTCLLGVNISMVIYALLFSSLMNPLWIYLGIKNAYVQLIIDTCLAAFLILIFGQFIPKAVFRARNDSLLSFFAPATRFFYRIFYPIASLLVTIAEWVLKYVFNVKVKDRNEVFNNVDLEHLLQQNKVQDEDSQELNTELFENALSLPMIKIRQCLVPRTEIDAVDIKASITQVKEHMIATRLSKLVVYDENIDNIVGYVHQLDLFKNPQDIPSVLLPIPAVPESMSATDLINKFSKERKSIAWVVDEFGGTAGIVTMEDVLEEIFGEIRDEYDVEEFVAKQISEDEYLFSGRLEIDYIQEKFDLEFTGNDSETLSGYIIEQHETIPVQKERIILDRYEFEILNVSDTRIEMVKLKILR
ncbi:HlyC/CorC family transporter [Segetibacter sp. 3557_3]|uniref:hemolysin family protein n=1 Tax=Segetibacter sp. 3557_3 TaxID=2547429 RepID=UPI00105860BC|nr:hemolysin family protein [Segetibacter sp. 3557_3]TDH20890.1 HlyC/CorC family transporter [Segetibacter sp. 3557_3]